MTSKELSPAQQQCAAQMIPLLEDNARLTDAQLAVMLGTSEADVAALRHTLEEQGVLRAYRTIIDWERTDRQLVTALIELRVTPRRDRGFEEIAEQVMRFEEVESVYLMSGAYDLMVILEGKSLREVANFVSDKLSTLDSVLSTATHFILKKYKEHGTVLSVKKQDEREMIRA